MVVDPTCSSRVVVVQDLYGRYLGYSEDKGVHFASKSHKLILKRTEVGVVLALRENPDLVLIQHEGSVLVERNPFDLTNASIVLYCNLQRSYAIQFSSAKSFMVNSHGKCIASDEPLGTRKTSKLFKVEVLLDSSPMKWPTRINLQGTNSKLYLENSHGQVMLGAAAKCCTEEFILEIPSVHTSSDSQWKGCIWYGDGAHVISANQAYSSLSLTPQHACFGREEFVYHYEGKNVLSFCIVEQNNRIKINLENEQKFQMEICSKPCAIVSVYGDVLYPFVFDDQVASNRVETVHISAQNTQKLHSMCSSWIFRHHGDCIYSIECSKTGQNLILSPFGCLAFSVNQDDRYPNQVALFEVEMLCTRLPGSLTIGGRNAYVTGFRISCVQKYNGCKMTLNALPDGSIRLLESSKVPCPDEIFNIADFRTAKNSVYLKGTIFDPHKDVMRKAKSHMVLGSQIYNPSVRASQSCDNIAAKFSEVTYVEDIKWGLISAASAEVYLDSFIADFISTHYDLQSPADIMVILNDLLPSQYIHCSEFTVLHDILSKRCAMNSLNPTSSKVSCADMIMTAMVDGHEEQGIMQMASTLDDEEKHEAFFCTACKGKTGLLKPLHPEINPEHHLYLKTMLRLQFGGTRTRRGLPTAHQSNRPRSTLLQKCIFLGACAFMAYKKVTST